jgi:class 3 adenylate cyclase
MNRFMSYSRLILFDQRGFGVSGPVRGEAVTTWEDWATDFERVLLAVDAPVVAILADYEAARWAILYAAHHPDRVSHLALWNASARTLEAPDYPAGFPPDVMAAGIDYMERVWGTPEALRLTDPSMADDPVEAAAVARYLRTCLAPSELAEYSRQTLALDVRDAVPLVGVPTLILQRRQHPIVPVDHGRYLAEHLPNARYVELDGNSGDIAAPPGDALALIEEFVTGKRTSHDTDRVLATVLFTDIVGSTESAAALGDTRWRERLDRHDVLVRREVAAHGGHVVKSTGDGALATFDSPTRAVRAAVAARDALATENITIRAGVHTGEIERRGDDIGGIAVHIAARVENAAEAGEVLVSRTVRDLTAGSGLSLHDRGTHVLKGIPDPWDLFAVH